MDVTTAVNARKSVRAFTDRPVDQDLIAQLLETAARAPSGGNVQPWRIYVLGPDAIERFRNFLDGRGFDEPEYEIYPPKLWEPYRTNRFALGEEMYKLLGIARDDRAGRLARMAENYNFFGAQSAFFCFIDRKMGPPQWSDLGMFLQSFMLLAQEAGLATCPQEAWASFGKSVQEFVGAPEAEMLFCGMAIGYEDTDAPVNQLVSSRMPLAEWATFL